MYESSFVEAAGVRLAFMRIGAPGPTLVFLHEGLGSIAQWRDFPESLARATGFGALVYERQGHGASDPLAGPRTARYLHDEALIVLPAVLSATGIGDAVLIGHSDGGSIALIYAGDEVARRDVKLRGVITEAAHVMVEEESLAGIRAAKKAYATTDLAQRLARYHGIGIRSGVGQAIRLPGDGAAIAGRQIACPTSAAKGSRPSASADDTRADALFFAWADAWLLPDFRELCLDEYVRRITCPILALQGADDEYGTPAQLDVIARTASAPVETVLIPNCRHTPHQQAREETMARMVVFIKGLPS
ncbi:MAG: alpha/beta hydrolase [Bryobacteraceae bacterium]